MSFLYLLIGVFLHQILPIFADNKINCPLHDAYDIFENGTKIQLTYQGFVSISYNRDNLAIYRYKATNFVNFLVSDAKIVFNGTFTKEYKKNVNLRSTLDTNIEGLAFRKKAEKDSYMLSQCKLDLKKNTKFNQSSPLNVQEKIVEVAHACIQTKLCSEFGTIDINDYIRATIEPYNFGYNSVMYITLKEKYPNLELPANTKKGQNLQVTLNVLADFWLASLVTRISGKQLGFIDIPDVNEVIPGIPIIKQGSIKLIGGTVGNFTAIKRSQDFKVTNNALEFAVEGGMELDNLLIHFDKFSFKLGVSSSGKIDVKMDRLKFNIKIAMNYNISPCKTSVVYLKPQIGEISFKLSDGSIFDGIISSIVSTAVEKCTNNIVDYLKTKMNQSISESLNAFECEQYRP